MKRTRNLAGLLCVLLAATLLAACSGADTPAAPPANWPEKAYELTAADLTVDDDAAQEIDLHSGDTFTITRGGAYVLSGQQEGQIRIDAQDEIVHLLLDGVSLHSTSGPAIYAESAAKLVITLKDGTTSSLSDSGFYKEYADQDACIFSNADLTINGRGTLEISGYYRDAIRSRDVIKILDGQLDIRAKKHGLRGTDGVVLERTQVSLQCEGCGILTTKANKQDKGFVSIDGGSVNIIAGETGIDVSENLYIRDTSVHVDGILENIACAGTQYVQEGCLQ